MQEIIKILNVIDTISDKINPLLKSYKPKSLESEFINGAYELKFSTDKDAAQLLYGTDQTDVRYKMLKHRIKKKVLHYLLHVEINNNNIVLLKEQECLKSLNISKILIKNYQYDLVLSLCSKTKAVALKYDFNEIILKALELEAACVADSGTYKQLTRIMNEQHKYQKLVNSEKEATSLFQQSKLRLKSTIKNRKAHLQEFPSVIKRLQEIWEKNLSYESYNAYFKTSIHYYELIGNFSKIIELTEEAEKLVKQGLVNEVRFSRMFNAYILIYAHLRNKSYADGLSHAEKFSPYFDESNPNWFSYYENYFLLALHAQQFELASLVIKRVQASSYFKNLDKDLKERWHLYNAYLYFFEPTYSTLEDFNYHKFLGSLTEYSKDKQGYNVAILILQFMYLLKKHDSESLMYKVESLKKYASTHLKDSTSLRSRLFLKLLALIVTEDFDAHLCKLKGEKLYQKLIETPTPGAAYAEIEIIPYEHLWEMTLKILESKY
jgi:hypothetical protein